MNNNNWWWRGKNKHIGLIVLRLSVGVIFLLHGLDTIKSPATSYFFSSGAGSFVTWTITVFEIVSGFALILGFWTRAFSLLLAIEMMLVVLIINWGQPFQQYQLEFLLLYTALALAAMGGGKIYFTNKCQNCQECGCSCHDGEQRCGKDGTCSSCRCK